MKKIMPFLFVMLAGIASAQNKHALIIAIGDYQPATNWGTLSSANDVPYIKKVLEKQAFPEKNITVIQDAAATKKGIENAFLKLISQVKPKDIVVIHVSSHGVQLEDDNGDESDMKDEAIVPYDAIYSTDTKEFEKYQGGYLRDDQFGNYIEQLRSKIGSEGDVIVFMDACHSGTGTRGTQKVRGSKAAMVSPTFSAKKTDAKQGNVFMEKAATSAAGKATYIVFSAARAEETNYETTDEEGTAMGSLTFALNGAFEKLQKGASYRSLFASVLAIMNVEVSNQNPVIEGNGIDRELFGGNFVEQKPYVEISTVEGPVLTLKSGTTSGLDEGSQVAVYKSGIRDPANEKLLAKGTVIKSEPFKATVQLETNPGILEPADAWVFVTAPVFKSNPIGVSIQPAGNANGFSADEANKLSTALQEIPTLVSNGGAPELLLTNGAEKDSIIVAGNGLFLGSFKNTTELKEQIKTYVQYKFLLSLEIQDPAYDLEIKLFPLIKGKADASTLNEKMVNGILEFAVGDSFVIAAKNKTQHPLYVNILDLQPDGGINAVFPNADYPIRPSELRIEAGQEYMFPYKLIIGPPLGMETYKVFVSRSEIDMENIARSNGARARGNFSSLQEIVNESFSIKTRGSSITKSTAPDGAVYSIVYRITAGK